jgi:type I restriction enzyme S subunit
MVEERYVLLKMTHFSTIDQWDIKRFMTTSINSKFKVQKLGKLINNENKKIKLFQFPKEKFKILGISNEIGMFDAYEEIGANINQSYIPVENGFLAYNPYRVNVGSIGIKTEDLKNNYISPAYVVFSCKERLVPEFLFLIMKSNTFNKLVRDNTTGSVRQTLSFNNLGKIKIPIPDTLAEQNCLVKKYDDTIIEAENCEKEIKRLEESIEEYLFDVLGIEVTYEETAKENTLEITSFTKLFKWGVEFNLNAINPKDVFKSNKYKNVLITSFCEINPTTTYPNDIEDVSFLPMECVSDVYGEIIETRHGKVDLAKGYTRFQENDILWAKITPCMQNGKCTVANDLENGYGYGSTEFHVFRALDGKAIPEYIQIFMRTRHIREVAQTYFTGSAGQQRVGADFLEALTLPAIPIDSENPSEITQTKIATRIREIKSQIKVLRQKAENLRQLAKKEFEEAVFDKEVK